MTGFTRAVKVSGQVYTWDAPPTSISSSSDWSPSSIRDFMSEMHVNDEKVAYLLE